MAEDRNDLPCRPGDRQDGEPAKWYGRFLVYLELGPERALRGLREREIGVEDAAVLTQHFWQGSGSGLEPGVALEEALRYCPPAVGESVVRYW